ncbi:hypothetical protein HK097_006302, partial [Rhizophlyctis rosea]
GLGERVRREDGLSVWFDVEMLRAGSGFEENVKGILGAKAFVACVTDEYAANPHCQNELAVAVENGVPIVPIIINEGTQWQHLIGAMLGSARYVNCVNGDEDSIRLAIDEIKAVVHGTQRPTLPPFQIGQLVRSPEALSEDVARMTLSEGARTEHQYQPLQSATPSTPTVVLTNSDPVLRGSFGLGARISETDSRQDSAVSVQSAPTTMSVADQANARMSERVVGRASRTGSGSSYGSGGTPTLSPVTEQQVQSPVSGGSNPPRRSLFQRPAQPPPTTSDPPAYVDAVPPSSYSSPTSPPPSPRPHALATPAVNTSRLSNSRSSTGTTINYSDRNLTSLDVSAITERLKSDRTVKRVYLQRTGLTSSGLMEILVGLGESPNVMEMNLSGNTAAFKGTQTWEAFGRWVGTYPSLRELDLSGCE